MRTVLIALSAVLMGTSAFAMPKVGDEAMFDFTVTKGTQTAKGTFELVLVSYDTNKHTFLQRITQTPAGGQPQVSEENVDASQLITDAQATDAVNNCAKYGGKSNSVTVAAGTFKTCDLPVTVSSTEKGTSSIAVVPFAEVKQDTKRNDGTHIVLELHSYKAGP
jgi:hypothetical protein